MRDAMHFKKFIVYAMCFWCPSKNSNNYSHVEIFKIDNITKLQKLRIRNIEFLK